MQNAGEPVGELPAGVFHSANMTDAGDWLDIFHGYQYDSFNPDALLHLARVENGRIVLPGGASYAMLVIPGIQAMQPNAGRISAAVAQRLLQLVREGATVLLAGSFTGSAGLLHAVEEDKAVQAVYRQLMAGPFHVVQAIAGGDPVETAVLGKGRVIKGTLQTDYIPEAGLVPDCMPANRAAGRGIVYTHRRAKGLDIYFVSNQADTARDIQLFFRVTGRRSEIWDPVTGGIRKPDQWQAHDNSHTGVPLHLDAGGSLFVVFREPVVRRKATSAPGGRIKKMPSYREPVAVQTLSPAWHIQFDTAAGGPAGILAGRAGDWSLSADSTIRYYSGTAVYTQSFNWKGGVGKHWLSLGRVGVIAQVWVNGVDCGVAWTAPWRVDIAKALRTGNNNLRVEVTNTWANRLQGDRRLPERRRLTWTTAPLKLLEGKPLPPSGLMGPVSICH
jgi:hypothetical protein